MLEDSDATLLLSYSYCNTIDTCLESEWLYIDRPCTSGWIRGVDMIMDSCAPVATSCQAFVSTSDAAGQWFNYTETLGLN